MPIFHTPLFGDQSGHIGSGSFCDGDFQLFILKSGSLQKIQRFGFEAELWEDKQKEAADLIDRLKNVVAIYTREVVMNNVMRGRWGSSDNWETRWALFDELVAQHNELGQKIDFSDLKREVDSVFLFDLCHPLEASITKSIENAQSKARKYVTEKYGKPVTDLEGFNACNSKRINEIQAAVGKLFEKAHRENIATSILELAESAKEKLSHFSITPDFNPDVLERLNAVLRRSLKTVRLSSLNSFCSGRPNANSTVHRRENISSECFIDLPSEWRQTVSA